MRMADCCGGSPRTGAPEGGVVVTGGRRVQAEIKTHPRIRAQILGAPALTRDNG